MPNQALGIAMTAMLDLLGFILLFCSWFQVNRARPYALLAANAFILVVALACPWLTLAVSDFMGVHVGPLAGAGRLAIAWFIYAVAIAEGLVTAYGFYYFRPLPPPLSGGPVWTSGPDGR